MSTKNEALSLVKAISSFILEHEGSKTVPTAVHMTELQKSMIEGEFPYLIDGNYYKDGKTRLRIFLNHPSNTAVGVGFTFFTDYPEMYQ